GSWSACSGNALWPGARALCWTEKLQEPCCTRMEREIRPNNKRGPDFVGHGPVDRRLPTQIEGSRHDFEEQVSSRRVLRATRAGRPCSDDGVSPAPAPSAHSQ